MPKNNSQVNVYTDVLWSNIFIKLLRVLLQAQLNHRSRHKYTLQRALQILLQPVPQSKIPLAETVFHPTMLSIKNLPHARFFIFYNAQDNSSQ